MDAEPAPKPQRELIAENRLRQHSTPERLKKTHTDEVVIALCGPIGSPLRAVGAELKRVMEGEFGYDAEIIILSKFIEKKGAPSGAKASAAEKVHHMIQQGNELRGKYGNGVLAELGIAQIHLERQRRKEKEGGQRFESQRTCYIFDSVKNREELDVLRLVYGDLLYTIGVFSAFDERRKELKARGISPTELDDIIDRDSGEEIGNGQSVEDTFPKADYFLKLSPTSTIQLETKVRRFLQIITRSRIVTPTPHETAMYVAASAAVNSACLSRQVGACVTNDEGKVLGVGWNDVPRFGGGLYDHENVGNKDRPDMRCMENGRKCFNQAEKRELATKIVAVLSGKNTGKKRLLKKSEETEALELILTSKVKDLIEFSRSVHAELHAMLNAAQSSGSQMKYGRLYCTTYPCHSCARHIIAAGINEVFYIEPYRKSLAIPLHGDAISEDEDDRGKKVMLSAYEGIAPRRYYGLFKAGIAPRKDSFGQLSLPRPNEAKPETDFSLEALPAKEGLIVKQLIDDQLITEEEELT
jgi:deoxycytidylate deaminase